MSWLFAFVAMAFLDFIWAEYTKAVTAGRVWVAAGLGSALFLMGGGVAISYVQDHWLLVPAACGSFLGTVLSLKFGSKS